MRECLQNLCLEWFGHLQPMQKILDLHLQSSCTFRKLMDSDNLPKELSRIIWRELIISDY